MKKFAFALIALTSLSGAALAERSYDLRDLQTVNGQSSSGVFLPSTGMTAKDESAAAMTDVMASNGSLTAYQRQLLNAAQEDNGEN